MADKKYDSIVYDYFEKKHGVVVLISEDAVFKNILASTIRKVIGSSRDCLVSTDNVQTGLKLTKNFDDKKTPATVFIERYINNHPSTDTIIALKKLLPEVKIIVLVGETRRENIAYFYEIGVNNVIAKPASVNNIIEKMAFTIKPQGKLSEYMGLGKRFLAAGKIQQALEVSDRILDIKPDSPAGLMLRGDALLEEGAQDEAIACYLKAHESSRLYLEPLKKLANAYKGVDTDKHLEYMKKLDRLSPLNTERKTEIGAVHMARKETQRAEKYFDQAIDAATQEAMSLVGSVAERISDAVASASPRMAEKYIQKAIEAKGNSLNRDDITLFNRMGLALRGQGKWREAIDNYTRAIQIAPNDEGLYYNMGMAYFDGGEKHMAAKAFDQALEVNPDFYAHSETVSMNLAAIYGELREYEKALPCYESVLRINPDNASAQRKLDALKQALKER